MAGRRVLAVFVVGTAVAASLSGCGKSPGAQLALSPVAAIAKVAENAGTESAAYALELSGSGLNVRANGVYRGGADPAAALTFTAMDVVGFGLGGRGTEFRLVDDVAYLRMGESESERSWLRLDDVASSGTSVGGLDPSFADPVGQLKKMLATDDVREIGPANVDGAKTTHYQAQVEPAELGDRVAATVDVWVDSEYRARKLVLELPILGGARMEMKFRDFGAPVDVRAPADSEVLDPAEFGRSLLGGGLFGDLLGDFGDLDAELERSLDGLGEESGLEEMVEDLKSEYERANAPAAPARAS
ncbi:MAG: hypothetical protein ACT4P1_16425 [Sporichthyaceae bacterium]